MHVERAAAAALTTLAFFAILETASGCHRAEPSAPTDPSPASTPTLPLPPPPLASAGCSLVPMPLRIPAPKRLVAIGDLHGDLGGLRSALRAAGAIDAHDHWTGGDLTILQTGDVLDRGDDEQPMLELLARLQAEAPESGGAVIQLLGNHELMNAAQDFRYVTPASRAAFGGDRAAALSPGGPWAKKLATHATVAIVGDTVFSHAGVLAPWAARLDEVNQADRCWLDGQGRDEPAGATAEDGPVWTRDYGGPQPDCAEVDAALEALGVVRMVVAHTVQPAGISSVCGDKLWRIDVGLGKEYGGPIEVLEVVPGAVPRVLKGTRGN